MLELERKGNEVFYNGRKLTIVKQETKGTGKEVVKIEGLPESQGQKWVSLSRLKEGKNSIECSPSTRSVGTNMTSTPTRTTWTKTYELTKLEQDRVCELQKEIDDIIAVAKKRYEEKPNLNVDISTLTKEQKQVMIEQLKKYLSMTEVSEEEVDE